MKIKKISSRIMNIIPSATIAVRDKARELQSKGINIINFGSGQPDFNISGNITEVAVQALREGFTKYTAVAGIRELKEAICDKLKRDNNVEYAPSEIIVSNGAKHALYNAFMTICDNGDEVLLPTPCWVSYVEQIKLAGATPVFVPTKEENNFRITIEDIKSKYNPKVKSILLNNPNNPSGAVYKKEDLNLIADFVIDKGIWVIVDEIYEKIIYDNYKHISIASLNQKIKEHTITINGVSKSYAMTGLRLGYAAGPKEIISAMTKLQGHVTGNVNSVTQKAAIEALAGPQEMVETMREEYTRRRDHVVKELNSFKEISCYSPDGAFYVFPNVSGLYGARFKDKIINNEIEAANYFLEEAHVGVVPGKAFEFPDHVRLTFAISAEEINEGYRRIKLAIDKLKWN